MNVLQQCRFTKPSVRDAGIPVSREQAEQQLLRQLQTKERPEEFVRWDLVCLYSCTARQGEALVQVRHLVEMAETHEQKASYYLALGQLMELRQHVAEAATCYLGAVETNAADPSGLWRLETLLESYPGIRQEVPDFGRQLWECRMAVEHAARQREKAAQWFDAEPSGARSEWLWFARIKRFVVGEHPATAGGLRAYGTTSRARGSGLSDL